MKILVLASRHVHELLDPAAGQVGQGLAHHVRALAVSQQLMDVATGQHKYLHAGLQLVSNAPTGSW